jgi:hypothetical protein
VVGTGGAVRPFTLCLSAQGCRCTDPTIAPAFDGLKISVSRRATFIDRSLLRSSFLGPRNERFNRCLSPPGFPQCPTVREVRGALILLAPFTEIRVLSFILPPHSTDTEEDVVCGQGTVLISDGRRTLNF